MAIEFNYEIEFELNNSPNYTNWINIVVNHFNALVGDLNYIFCSDAYLLEINKQYLNHDTLTDIITFDYTDKDTLSGDIFISIDRVKENATTFNVAFEEELKRVMIHGVLHLLDYTDKTDDDKAEMRNQENQMIQMFHVEQ